MKWTLLLLSCIISVSAIEELTPEQEAWLQSVSHANITKGWPGLSSKQIQDLYFNVRLFKELTEIVNYPYNQAVEVWFTDKNRATIDRYDDVGDGAAWTGLHLAALIHEYNVTHNKTILQQAWSTLSAIDFISSCTSKPGYIPRFVGMANDTIYSKYYKGYSNGAFPCISPYETYTWLGSSSRDMYFGIAFGLCNVLVYLQSNETFVKKTTDIIERIVDCLQRDHFFIISPKNQITNPLPLFSATWRLLALTVNPKKYGSFKIPYDVDFEAAYLSEMDLGSKWESYYPNELLVEGLFILSLLDKDSKHIDKLFKKFVGVASENYDHLQPGFAAFFLSAFPNTTQHKIPQGILQGGLYDYPVAPDWDHSVDQSTNPDYLPHHDSTHSERALMIRDRPPQTYLWQRAPTTLSGGEGSCCLQRKHQDIILAYWMGRSSGFI